MQVQVGAYSDAGQMRSVNQDRYAVRGPHDAEIWDTLLVVADGMGGHEAGEVASFLAVEQVVQVCESAPGRNLDLQATLRRAIVKANETIRQAAAADQTLHGMGTTVTAALVRDGLLYVGHVGDSRLYLVRKSAIYQLTQDHTWVAREVREGRLTALAAEHHPERHVLTQAVGGSAHLDADTGAYSLESGDILLLCTDGLSSLVNEQELTELTREFGQPAVAAEQLVTLANQRGAPDNVTAVVARVVDQNRERRATRELSVLRKRPVDVHRLRLGVGIGVVTAALLVLALYVLAASNAALANALAHVLR
jgi:protein phosphatase